MLRAGIPRAYRTNEDHMTWHQVFSRMRLILESKILKYKKLLRRRRNIPQPIKTDTTIYTQANTQMVTFLIEHAKTKQRLREETHHFMIYTGMDYNFDFSQSKLLNKTPRLREDIKESNRGEP